nr:hypothetical protein GCM10020092_033670 [Actinoplanes digitatis]
MAAYTLRGSSGASSSTGTEASGSPHDGQASSNRPSGEIGDGARGRAGRAVYGAGVRAFAVHDHRAGQHESVHTGPGHLGEQHGGAEIVAADVLRQIVEVDAHADHGRLVHDRLDAAQRVGDRGPVPDIGPVHRSTVDGVRRRGGVCGGMADVEDADLVPGVLEGGGHVGADETGAAGHEYVGHGPTLGTARRHRRRSAKHVSGR